MKIFGWKTETFAVDAGRSEEAVNHIHEDGVIDRNRKLDVAWMARTSCLVQVTCCTPIFTGQLARSKTQVCRAAENERRVTPRSQSRVVETAWDRVEKIVECAFILDALDRDCLDFLGREERELDTLHFGGDRRCDIHGDADVRTVGLRSWRRLPLSLASGL